MTTIPREEWLLAQEPDQYSRRKGLVIAIGSMLVILLVMVICDLLLQGAYHGIRWTSAPLSIPAGRAPREIGGVKQTLIRVDAYGQRLLQRQHEDVERYEWVDRDRGIVNIPVEQGMRLVIERGGK